MGGAAAGLWCVRQCFLLETGLRSINTMLRPPQFRSLTISTSLRLEDRPTRAKWRRWITHPII
jgi:hypothetical protein